MNDDRDAWLDEVKQMVFGDKLPAHMRPKGAAVSKPGAARPVQGQGPSSATEAPASSARSQSTSALLRVRSEVRRSSMI